MVRGRPGVVQHEGDAKEWGMFGYATDQWPSARVSSRWHGNAARLAQGARLVLELARSTPMSLTQIGVSQFVGLHCPPRPVLSQCAHRILHNAR